MTRGTIDEEEEEKMEAIDMVEALVGLVPSSLGRADTLKEAAAQRLDHCWVKGGLLVAGSRQARRRSSAVRSVCVGDIQGQSMHDMTWPRCLGMQAIDTSA
jgi:hypothetical protein